MMSTTRSHHRLPISELRYGSTFELFILILFLLLISHADAQVEWTAPPGQYGRQPDFSYSVATRLLILIIAFIVVAFLFFFIRRCYGGFDDHGGRSNRGGVVGVRSRRSVARGLDPAVIETFPTLLYSDVKGHKIGKGTLECAVCLSEFEDSETLRLLPKCSHVFHPDCIDAWLAAHTTCPVCRSNLVPDPNAPPAPAYIPTAAVIPAPGGEDGQQEVVVDAAPQDHVAINIEGAEERIDRKRMDSVDLIRIGSKNRVPWRARSIVRPAKFPRSHSTGHSVVQPGENVERFTLRLPEHVRRDVIAGTLNRSASSVSLPRGEGSSRRGYRGAFGEGSSRSGRGAGGRSFKLGRWDWAAKSDRWTFMARTFSFGVPKSGESRRSSRLGDGSIRRGEGSTTNKGGEGEASSRGKMFPTDNSLGGAASVGSAVSNGNSSATALASKV